MTTPLNRLGQALLLAFGVVAMALGYWGLIRRDALLVREDNPRRFLEEQRTQRGQIVDRHEIILAATLTDPASGLTARHYPYPEAAPVVGYYSLRHGVGGIEAAYDNALRGLAWTAPAEQVTRLLLHRPQIGGDIQLTLDAQVQQDVHRLLHDRRGAIILVSVPQGEVLALVSNPTFDANRLDEQWETLSDDPTAPLLNRATQGLYQPGTILQSAVLGAALDAGETALPANWEGALSAPIDDGRLPCAGAPPGIENLNDAFLWSCPGPFVSLARAIGQRRLTAALNGFGLLEAPIFELPTVAADLAGSPSFPDPDLDAIGQGSLTVTPLHMAQVAAALANHGEIPAFRVVQAIRQPGGTWQPVAPLGHPRGTISRASADQIAQWMRQAVSAGAARAAALPFAQVHGHVGLALGGPQGTLHAWFIGFAHRPTGGAIAVAVLLEDQAEPNLAAQIGGQALQAALERAP